MNEMLIVLSMHRSGSSLLTGLLHRFGLYAGEPEMLIDSRSDNQMGFWEHKDVVKLNKSILHKGGFGTMLPDMDNHYSLVEHEKEQIADLVFSLGSKGINVVKDPRFCVTLPAWRVSIPKPKLVHLTRHPIEVAKSLYARQRYPINAGLALWEYYNLCALRNASDLDVFHLHFNQLKTAPLETAEQVIEWFGAPPRESKDTQDFEFDEKLIHQNTTENDRNSLTPSQVNLYRSLVERNSYDLSADSDTMRVCFEILREFQSKGFSPVSGRCRDPEDIKSIRDLEEENQKFKHYNRQFKQLVSRLLNSRAGKLLNFYYLFKSRLVFANPSQTLTSKIKQLIDASDDRA